jgi:hypothetical protein
MRRTRAVYAVSLVLAALSAAAPGCSQADRAINSVNDAIAELQKGNKTFEDIKTILEGTKKNLDNGVYKDQVDELIGRTGQVAQLGVEGSVDFTRTRVIEDLENLKRSMLGQQPLPRVPVLANSQSPKIDFKNPARSTLTVVGWNLDVAQRGPEKYKVVVKNAKTGDRTIDRRYVTFQGQYAVTIDVSASGIPFQHEDAKLVFDGFNPPFEIAIVNTERPPDPEVFTELVIESHQNQDDKDPEAEVRFTVTVENDAPVSFVLSGGDRWNDPGVITIKVWPNNPTDRLGTTDAIHRYGSLGLIRPEVKSRLDNCNYLVVQPGVSKLISGTGKRGSLLVEKLHDNQGWHAHFVLRGRTNKGAEKVLVSSPDVWFVKHESPNSHRWEFTW